MLIHGVAGVSLCDFVRYYHPCMEWHVFVPLLIGEIRLVAALHLLFSSDVCRALSHFHHLAPIELESD